MTTITDPKYQCESCGGRKDSADYLLCPTCTDTIRNTFEYHFDTLSRREVDRFYRDFQEDPQEVGKRIEGAPGAMMFEVGATWFFVAVVVVLAFVNDTTREVFIVSAILGIFWALYNHFKILAKKRVVEQPH